MYTSGGLSTGVTETPPQTQQGFAEPTLETYVQPRDSVEGLSRTHTPHGTETQRKKAVESGSQQTAQGLSRRSLAYFSQHRDSAAESGSTHTAQGLSRRMQLSLAHNSRHFRDPRTPRRSGKSLAYIGYIQ